MLKEKERTTQEELVSCVVSLLLDDHLKDIGVSDLEKVIFIFIIYFLFLCFFLSFFLFKFFIFEQ